MLKRGIGPNAFEPCRVIAVPDGLYICFLPQVIDMPVGTMHWLQMVFDTGLDATGAKSAAKVHTER